MDEEIINIAVGNIAVAFRLSNRRLGNAVRRRYGGFIVKVVSGSMVVDCSCSRKKLGSCEQVRLSTKDTGAWSAERFDFRCTWNTQKGLAVLWPSLYSFDAMLRVVVSARLLSCGGLLVHASAVVHKNAAYVFAGPSGSGKTTIARNSRCRKILSDEIVALSVDKSGNVAVTGTPFWGEMGSGPAHRRRYFLKSLFFIKKGRVQNREFIALEKAVGKLLICVCVFGNSNEECNIALDICIRILDRVDYSILYFTKKSFDWKAVDSAV